MDEKSKLEIQYNLEKMGEKSKLEKMSGKRKIWPQAMAAFAGKYVEGIICIII